MRNLLLAILAQYWILSLVAISGSSQNEKPAQIIIPRVSTETYQKVLDIIFPRDYSEFDGWENEARLSLRYKPSFDREMQINLVKLANGRVGAVIYTLPKESVNIWEQLNKMLRKGKQEDAKEMAKEIAVNKEVVNDSAEMRRLFNQFIAMSIPIKLENTITLDGIRFELWFKTGLSEYYFSFEVSDLSENQLRPYPIVRWMNEVRRSLVQ